MKLKKYSAMVIIGISWIIVGASSCDQLGQKPESVVGMWSTICTGGNTPSPYPITVWEFGAADDTNPLNSVFLETVSDEFGNQTSTQKAYAYIAGQGLLTLLDPNDQNNAKIYYATVEGTDGIKLQSTDHSCTLTKMVTALGCSERGCRK